jgi:hypothetical protein
VYANYPNSIEVFTFETTKPAAPDNLQLRINKSAREMQDVKLFQTVEDDLSLSSSDDDDDIEVRNTDDCQESWASKILSATKYLYLSVSLLFGENIALGITSKVLQV